MKGSQPKTQGTPRTQERGIRTAIIISNFTSKKLEELKSDGEANRVEQDKMGKEMMAAVRAAMKNLDFHKNDLFYLVYENSGEIHLVPMAKNLAKDLKVLSAQAMFAMGKFARKVGSFFSSREPAEADVAASTVDDIDQKQQEAGADQLCALTGMSCGLSYDASGGLVMSQLYFGDANAAQSTHGENHE